MLGLATPSLAVQVRAVRSRVRKLVEGWIRRQHLERNIRQRNLGQQQARAVRRSRWFQRCGRADRIFAARRRLGHADSKPDAIQHVRMARTDWNVGALMPAGWSVGVAVLLGCFNYMVLGGGYTMLTGSISDGAIL